MRLIFTNHARIRIKERNISVEDVKTVLNNPEQIGQINEKKFYYLGIIKTRKIKVIVLKNKDIIKIITVYPI